MRKSSGVVVANEKFDFGFAGRTLQLKANRAKIKRHVCEDGTFDDVTDDDVLEGMLVGMQDTFTPDYLELWGRAIQVTSQYFGMADVKMHGDYRNQVFLDLVDKYTEAALIEVGSGGTVFD